MIQLSQKRDRSAAPEGRLRPTAAQIAKMKKIAARKRAEQQSSDEEGSGSDIEEGTGAKKAKKQKTV